MHETRIETIVHIPWGTDRTQLPLSLVPFPEHSERATGAARSPEFPLCRVYEDGRVAALNHLGNRYLPADTLKWFHVAPAAGRASEVVVQTAGYPFPAQDGVLSVDFFVKEDGALILLENVGSGEGGTRTRLAAISGDGALLWKKDALDEAYIRIVPDDRGRLFVLAHEHGNQLRRLDPDTGSVEEQYAAEPGTRLAIEANQGTRIAARHLGQPDQATIQAPPDAPQTLTYLFGIDARGDYYARLDTDIVVVDFAGTVLRQISLDDVPALIEPGAARAERTPRLAPLPSWQVDPAGRIYVPRVDATGFSLLRITQA
jgi:hypothetical protein